ncbi:MAG: exported protein of unknown function [Deltaproteobacteria bacterium]|nr:exported protein of unknown function [Deltaproteobacteria bacterium]
MKWMRQLFLALFAWLLTQGLVYATGRFGEAESGPTISCGYARVDARYTAKVANYSFTGGCLQSPSEIQIPWSVSGAHHEGIGFTEEKIYLSGPSPYRGQISFTMTCANLRSNLDPWLTVDGGCGQFTTKVEGEIAGQKLLLDTVYKRVGAGRGRPLTASFGYDRNALLAKRAVDLKAEADAIANAARREQHRLQGAEKFTGTSYTANLSPSVWAPTAGQMFYSKAPVPIKLAPPKGLTGGSYMVNIQRFDATGKKWVAHATIPVGAAQAHLPGGYTGWGAGGTDGRSLAFMTSPGSWRLSAQVSSPKQSGWSNWVNFNVMAPQSPTATKPKRIWPGQ